MMIIAGVDAGGRQLGAHPPADEAAALRFWTEISETRPKVVAYRLA